jgi:hypothetical protein
MKIYGLVSKKPSMIDFEKKNGKPLFSKTQKTIKGAVLTSYTFNYKNKCTLVVLHNTLKQSVTIVEKKCPSQSKKCEDSPIKLKMVMQLLKLKNCADLHAKLVKGFGFKCNQNIQAFGAAFKLAEHCCATCKNGPKTTKKATPKPKPCGAPDYVGDGVCDDNNNHKDCKYDGGDCCPKSVKGGIVKKTYCKECKCIDPKNQGPPAKPVKPATCGSPDYKGDGNCDDDNNNKGCDYDGGDCCAKSVNGGKVKKNYCKECKCKDPKNA